MTVVGSAVLELRGDVSDFVRKMDSAVKKFDDANAHFKRIGDRLTSIGTSLTTYVSLPIAAAGTAAVIAATKMDSLRRGLIAVTGSASEAERQFQELREIAKLPGLGLSEAIEGATRLQAAGLSAEEATGALRHFGNALATVGAGRAELDGVVRALTQIASKSVVSAEEINQLAERLPQIRQAMIAAFGTASTEEIQKLGVSTKEFIRLITAEFAKLERVTGGPQVAFENLTDSLFIMADAMGRALLPVVVPMADALARMAEMVANLNPAVRTAIVVVAGLAAALGPLSLTAGLIIKNLPLIATGFKALTGPIGLTVAAITALTGAWLAHGAEVPTVVRATFNVVTGYLGRLARFMGDVFDAIVDASKTAWRLAVQPIIDFVRVATEWLVDKFGGVLGKVARFFVDLVDKINPALGLAVRGIQAFVDDVQSEMKRMEQAAVHGNDGIIALSRTLSGQFSGGLDLAAESAGNLASNLEDVAAQVRKIVGFSEAGPLLGDPFIVDPSRRTSARPGTDPNASPGSDRPGSGNFGGIITDRMSPLSRPSEITANAPGTSFIEKIKDGFGKLGDIVAGLLPSLSLVSVGFAFLAPIIKGVGEVLQPAIEALLEPLVEVGRVLGGIIKPILDALKEPLRLLADLLTLLLEPLRVFVELLVAFELPLKVLSGAIRFVTVAISYMYQAIGIFVEALGVFVDSIVPDFISHAGKGLAETGRQMQANARAIRNGTDAQDEATKAAQEAMEAAKRRAAGEENALDGVAKAANQAASALSGVPEGFRILNVEMARFNAMQRETAGTLLARMGGNRITALDGMTVSGGGTTSGAPLIGAQYFTIEVTQQAGESGEQFARRVVEIMETNAVHKNLTDGKTAQDAWAPR